MEAITFASHCSLLKFFISFPEDLKVSSRLKPCAHRTGAEMKTPKTRHTSTPIFRECRCCTNETHSISSGQPTSTSHRRHPFQASVYRRTLFVFFSPLWQSCRSILCQKIINVITYRFCCALWPTSIASWEGDDTLPLKLELLLLRFMEFSQLCFRRKMTPWTVSNPPNSMHLYF